ncbi:MAG: hypothetical protein AJITA_01404 [Acetilactobacillus jinshanensis]
MAKFHHKLQYLTHYLNRDLQLANSQADNLQQAVDLATATVGVALGNMSKALKMRSAIASSEKTYKNQQHPYNLKVAILVSRHNVIDGPDYPTIKAHFDQLSSDQNTAEQKLPLPRKKFLGIF